MSAQSIHPSASSTSTHSQHSNTSQFFFTLSDARMTSRLTGKHVVFGELVEGADVLDAIEAVGNRGGDDERPAVDVVIADCGLL